MWQVLSCVAYSCLKEQQFLILL
uniref:Uncharacterized protein n=1 Tax=Arundo donax TaxID=35708 RepID=A0A0A9BER9_ARUDO